MSDTAEFLPCPACVRDPMVLSMWPAKYRWEAHTELIQRHQEVGVGGGVICRSVPEFDWAWWRKQIGTAGLMLVFLTIVALLVVGVATGATAGVWWLAAAGIWGGSLGFGWQAAELIARCAKRRREIAETPAEQREAEAEPDEPKPVKTKPLATWPTREFTAACECPSCGWIDVHLIRQPDQPDDPEDAAVIRQCGNCTQEWAEK